MVTKAGTVQWFIVKREYNCGQRVDPTSRLPISNGLLNILNHVHRQKTHITGTGNFVINFLLRLARMFN